MNITTKDIITILGFLGLGSWGAWVNFHDTYVEDQYNEKRKDELLKKVIEGDVLNEQKKLNIVILKRLDTLSINYNDIGVLFDMQKETDNHVQKLEKFNEYYGYKY